MVVRTAAILLLLLVACGAPKSDLVDPGAPAQRDVTALSPSEVRSKLAEDPTLLGSVSLGRPHGGALFGGVPMSDDEHWNIVDPVHAFGTTETVDYLTRAVRRVTKRFPDGDAIFIGQLSRETGGKLWPHASHQSGRDADVGYYYLPGTRGGWYQRVASNNLDRERTWALIRTLVVHTDVEHIFISKSVQRLLHQYALEIGEDPDWLKSIFAYRSNHPNPLILDAMGHTTHMHVRFFNPQAQYLGVHAHAVLMRKTRHRRILQATSAQVPPRRLPPAGSDLATAQ